MLTYKQLIQRYRKTQARTDGQEMVHVTLAGFPGRIGELELAINSLIGQADTVHVYLNEFETVPGFLDHDRIFITRSQDFGVKGECGKYYWCDDLAGYHFICSDQLLYPSDYIFRMIGKIEDYSRKAVIAAGGYLLQIPFTGFDSSVELIRESALLEKDVPSELVRDLALAYHSSAIKVSRHVFYQAELSEFWFSITGHDQNIPFICLSHQEGWIKFQNPGREFHQDLCRLADLRTLLIRNHFLHNINKHETDETKTINDLFDRIYVMNLERRPDRWDRIRQAAGKHGINVYRFPAVDGYQEPYRSNWERYFARPLAALPEGIEPLEKFTDKFTKYHHYIARVCFMESKLQRKAVQTPGAFGYAHSYIAILEEAIKKGYQRILILDDDVLFHKDFNAEFEKGVKQLPGDWRLIMLGAMQHQWEPWIKWYSENLYQCHGSSVASHAVGIDCRMFLPLLHYAMNPELPVDEGAISHVQNVYDSQCFIFYPNLAIQDTTESDISTSAMKTEDTGKWMKIFRWETELYDYPEIKSSTQ